MFSEATKWDLISRGSKITDSRKKIAKNQVVGLF